MNTTQDRITVDRTSTRTVSRPIHFNVRLPLSTLQRDAIIRAWCDVQVTVIVDRAHGRLFSARRGAETCRQIIAAFAVHHAVAVSEGTADAA